jgi:four helix bundle protein
LSLFVRAKCAEELQVYQRALQLADEVSAILKRPGLERDFGLRDQLRNSSAAVPALIAEGFSQSTDRYFAAFLYRARGESSETRTHLRIARGRNYVTDDECHSVAFRYNEVEKMLTGLIRHLQGENRRDRG